MSEKILWIDDEINLLKPHILFLEKRGYRVDTINNGADALNRIRGENHYSAILLDENMPGIDGLETLESIKQIKPTLPVVMITKSEEEYIMEDAIGSYITDYLIKPVNPNQILLSLKKIFEARKIITEKMTIRYQQKFREISIELMQVNDLESWQELYRKLVFWELELEKTADPELLKILEDQKHEANQQFFKFIKNNYCRWLHSTEGPVMSHNVFRQYIKPHLSNKTPTLLVLIDNFRYDQWKSIEPLLAPYYDLQEELLHYSILPSATSYVRNSFFAGLMPLEIEKRFPKYWRNDIDEGKKNDFEELFMHEQLKRLGLAHLKSEYYKINTTDDEKRLYQIFSQIANNDFTVIVCNIVDILSHAKTDNHVVSQLIRDNETYRALTKNWFEHSFLLETIKKAAEAKIRLLFTTDHGTIFVTEPSKVIGDKETNTNLRYKLGKNLNYNEKKVLVVHKPEEYFLPKLNVSSKYIFARENVFLAYPNNYNYYVKYYKNTYQHGGVSLEEMIVPFSIFEPK
ncbi:MAG: response regulator [Flavobacteriales bacterium]